MKEYMYKVPAALLTLVLLLLCSIGSVSAQNSKNSRELRGNVYDETGAYIVAASVSLDDGKGHHYEGTSDEKGRYRISGIEPGIYTLTVSAEGFASSADFVDLTSRNVAGLNTSLKVQFSEELEIRPDTPAISTEPDKNLSAITLSGEELESLPDDPDDLLQTLREMAGPSAGPDDAQLFVDGFREGGRIPPKEAILSIRINSNPFSAEYSEPGNSRIEIITKPGSDSYHGSFRFNFNDESLNSRNAFALFRSPLQVRNYNANFSGPIIRNRWGFFADFERRSQDENDVINAVVLDPITLQPKPFVTTVLTPGRNTNFTIRTDFLVNKSHTLGFSYRYIKNDSDNQGLDSGFDLPERAFNRTTTDDRLRFSLTSILSPKAVSEFRMEIGRRNNDALAVTPATAVQVFDAFTSGGNQGSLFNDSKNDHLEIAQIVTYTYKSHSLKLGAQAESDRIENINRSNFGGTFTFGSDFERDANGIPVMDANGRPIGISPLERYRRTLLGMPGYRPSQFSIVEGDPFVGLSQWEFSFFAQDDWRISPRFTLSYGVRSEFQTHLEDRLNFAPRIGIALTPDKKRKSTIRAGVGIFYNRLDSNITFDTTRLDGEHQLQFIIQQPPFFPNIPDMIEGAVARRPTIRIKADDLNAAYSILSTVSYERQLPLKLLGSITYNYQRGIHLLRTRNINAPQIGADGSITRPFPDSGPILQYETTGLSTRHEIRFGVRTGFNKTLTLFGNYILSSTRSDVDGASSAPADSNNLSNEFSRAAFDQRHRLFIGGSIALPWNMRLNPFVFITSGRPFNITTGRDNNGDTLFTDRPGFAAPGDPEAVVTRFGLFNPNPRPGDLIIPRNFGDGPGQTNVNLNFSKTFGFGALPQRDNAAQRFGAFQGRGPGGFGGGPGGGGPGGGGAGRGGFGGGGFGDARYKYNLTLAINVQNLINKTNLPSFNGVLSSSSFGTANRALPSRRVEVSLRFSF